MRLGVVIPCYRQERFLPRTLAALEHSLAGRDWSGVLVLSAPGEAAALPPLSQHWRVVRPVLAPDAHPLTPGAARNAGFAASGGTWVLFVDADVEVDSQWIVRAFNVMSDEPRLAGLWGRLEEWFVDGGHERPGSRDMYRVGDDDHDSDYLATLALYRRVALEQVGGYEPSLSSEEDFELGLRLRREGFVLRSVAPCAGRHWSGPRPSFSEIGRRWRSGLCFGQGQVLRLYAGRPGFNQHLRRQSLYLGTLAFWSTLPAFLLGGHARLWFGLALAFFVALSVRKRSPRLALHSLLMWTVNTAGMLVGLTQRRSPAVVQVKAV
ncbi:MAG: glycosyltransferase [Candidatus Eisenbacteria bacterium]